MEAELLERLAHLVVAQVEDVLRLGEEPVVGEQRAELAHLVPEDREEPVLDVEVVVLDERVDRAREREALVEGWRMSSASSARCSAVIRSRSASTAAYGREMSSPASSRRMYAPMAAIGSRVSSIQERWWW